MDPLLKELTGFGLSAYEAKCYTVLIRKKEMAAVEISKIGGIPRSRIYEVLESLLLKGLCCSVPGPVVKYRGVGPEALKDRYEHNLEKIRREIEISQDKLTSAIKSRDKTVGVLSNIFEQGQELGGTDPLDYIEVIKNSSQIYKRYVQFFHETQKEILSLTKEKPTLFSELEKEVSKEQDDLGISTMKRGVQIRCIYELSPDDNSEDDNKAMLKHIGKFVKAGEKARILEKLPLKMFIFDSKISMFTLEGPDFNQPFSTLQIIRHPAVAQALTMLFESLWEKAEDYDDFMNRKYR